MSIDKRSDGTRFNWTGLGSRYASCEMILYVRHPCGSFGDEVSGKMGGGKHSSGSRPRCYDIGVDSDNGNTRLRVEDKHPQYDTVSSNRGDAPNQGVGLGGNWIGYCFIKRNMNGYVLLQVWQDAGNNNGSTPANAWKLIGSWNCSNPYWPNPPSDHQETVRIDNVDCLEHKWGSLREITGNASTTPGTGGVGGGTTGGGTIGGGTIGGGTTGGGQVPGGQIPGGGSWGTGGTGGVGGSTGGGIGSGDGSGGTGTGVDTPNPAESTVLYERKEYWIRYNINFISGDACGVGKNPQTSPLVAVYKVQGDVYVEGKNYSRVGIHIAKENKDNPAETSRFIGLPPIRAMTLVLRRAGTNSMSGNINIRIRDKNYSIVAELGTIAITAVQANDLSFPLSFPNNLRDLKVGDHLSIEYDGNNQTDYLRVKVNQFEKFDGALTRMFVFDGNAYIYDDFADLAAEISV